MKKKGMLFILMAGMLMGIFCGCKGKEVEEAATKVIKISITPIPSPTPALEELNQDAIVKKGTITMVNEYTINDKPAKQETEETVGEEDGEETE